MKQSLRTLLFPMLLSTALVLFFSTSHAEKNSLALNEATDLAVDGADSRQTGRPMLLLVSQEHCPYCVLIKNEILKPMILSGDYADRIIMREIFIDLGTDVRTFFGKTEDSADFAHGYGVYLTPTLLFLGPDGEELSKRIVGINTPEMFSFYVDEAIDDAIEELRTR